MNCNQHYTLGQALMLDHVDFPTMYVWTLGAPLIASWSSYLAPSRGAHSFRLLSSSCHIGTDLTQTLYSLSDMLEMLLFCTAIVDQLQHCCAVSQAGYLNFVYFGSSCHPVDVYV